MKRFIAVVLAVLTLMMVSLAPVVSASAKTNYPPSDDDNVVESVIKWNMRGVEHVAEGIAWVGGKVADGACWTAEKVADGAVYAANKVADGAKYVWNSVCSWFD